jgi:hypothetical protein
MRVSRTGGAGPTSPRASGGSGPTGAAFTLAAPASRPAESLGCGIVGAPASLGAMLALQAVADPAERRRRAVRRGHALLDRLEELRLGLLEGGVPQASLRHLRSGLAGDDLADEPQLRAVLEGIELRAAVELAKLEAGGAAV